MEQFRHLSNDDLLFEKYLVQVRIRSAEDLLESNPPNHEGVLKVYKDLLCENKTYLERLDQEIKKRNLVDRDLWTGEEPHNLDNVEDSTEKPLDNQD